jgi:cell division protein FtsZ
MATASIREAIAGTDVLFITSGTGRGTDTSTAPAIARVAREMGIFTIGLATTPVDIEGLKRMANADACLAEFEQNVDSLIVASYEKLMETVNGGVTPDKAFAHVFKNVVSGITNIVSGACNPYIGVDFEDTRTVLELPGKARVGMAMTSGPDRARIAAEQAMACPLLEGMALAEAQGVLIFISASQKSLRLSDTKLTMTTIRACVSADTHIICGAACDDSMGDAIHVTVVATGLR